MWMLQTAMKTWSNGRKKEVHCLFDSKEAKIGTHCTDKTIVGSGCSNICALKWQMHSKNKENKTELTDKKWERKNSNDNKNSKPNNNNDIRSWIRNSTRILKYSVYFRCAYSVYNKNTIFTVKLQSFEAIQENMQHFTSDITGTSSTTTTTAPAPRMASTIWTTM